MGFVTLKWIEGDAKGYTDWFSQAAFSRAVSGAEQTHVVRGPKGGVYHARYRLSTRNALATLDYSEFEAFNEAHGMELGTMTIEFLDKARQRPTRVLWNGKAVTPTEATVQVEAASLDQRISGGYAERRIGEQLARPEQSRFRQVLDLAYGSRCCITGCNVPASLQAAHLIRFSDGGADDASNGLLLRADLHALLDDYHLAIEPRTRLVHFSPEAQNWNEYKVLHRKAKLRPPQEGFQDHAPASASIDAIWSRFQAEHIER